MALLDNKNQVVARTWLEDSRPGTCPGGEGQTEHLKARLADVPAGDYRLAIGLFRDRQAGRPDVKLGLKDITPDNWHPLARVHMDGNQQSKEQSRAHADTK